MIDGETPTNANTTMPHQNPKRLSRWSTQIAA